MLSATVGITESSSNFPHNIALYFDSTRIALLKYLSPLHLCSLQDVGNGLVNKEMLLSSAEISLKQDPSAASKIFLSLIYF